jgi:hypothetical protein
MIKSIRLLLLYLPRIIPILSQPYNCKEPKSFVYVPKAWVFIDSGNFGFGAGISPNPLILITAYLSRDRPEKLK